jgi:hypothetical protein
MNLETVTKEVDSFVDGLGKKLDAGIKCAVISFRLLGFQTTMSCEGHMRVWGTPFPWVEISSINNSKEKVQTLLNQFYSNREGSLLRLQIIEYSDRFRIQFSNESPHGGLVKGYVRDESILLAARQEMDAFATYIRDSV